MHLAPKLGPPSRHSCERNASGPRARLSSVESDLQGDPWHGSRPYPRGSTARCAGRDAMMAPPASTPRAHLSPVESDLVTHGIEAWRSGGAGAERSRRKIPRGRSDGWAPRRPGSRPHPAIRPPENAQNRRSEPEACLGATPRSARGQGGLLDGPKPPDLSPIPSPVVTIALPAPITRRASGRRSRLAAATAECRSISMA